MTKLLKEYGFILERILFPITAILFVIVMVPGTIIYRIFHLAEESECVGCPRFGEDEYCWDTCRMEWILYKLTKRKNKSFGIRLTPEQEKEFSNGKGTDTPEEVDQMKR